MDTLLRRAGPDDADLLVEMMTEFYGEADYPLNPRRARAAFAELLADERLGHVWLVHDRGAAAGYIVLTLAWSMEYGGLSAFVDDLFVRAAHRGRGLGRAAINAARDECVRLGVRALHLEVGRDNMVAQSLYRSAGFTDHDRQLLTLSLAEPTHILDAAPAPPL